jgi:hypothetical protein
MSKTKVKNKIIRYRIDVTFDQELDGYGMSIQDVLEKIREDCSAEIYDVEIINEKGKDE